jgi:hypothetical protein
MMAAQGCVAPYGTAQPHFGFPEYRIVKEQKNGNIKNIKG